MTNDSPILLPLAFVCQIPRRSGDLDDYSHIVEVDTEPLPFHVCLWNFVVPENYKKSFTLRLVRSFGKGPSFSPPGALFPVQMDTFCRPEKVGLGFPPTFILQAGNRIKLTIENYTPCTLPFYATLLVQQIFEDVIYIGPDNYICDPETGEPIRDPETGNPVRKATDVEIRRSKLVNGGAIVPHPYGFKSKC